STVGTITDIDGNFSMNKPVDGGNMLEISYLGYETMVYDLSEGMDLGVISLTAGMAGLEEVVVTGVMDIVRDRRTPVAVSTISASEIQAKAVGNVELPDVAKATPSIYVANQAGGYGEAQVWTRGFSQVNTAFLLNGQPINGMEDGKMYWSNWSGLTDVASAVQIQRGLGASSLAISSVGGTWNFIMKATDNKKGGNVFTTVGNNNYQKIGATYSTGLIDDKFAVTALLSSWSGDGWAHGTQGAGQTYFLSMGYKPAANHNINFLITGAPQYHDQKYSTSIYNHEDSNGDIDPRYNGNWGIYDGEYFSERRNYYHKPVMNLNWEWEMDEKSSLGTVLYGSFGRGGGTGGIGGGRVRTESGLINFDATAADTSATYIRRASVNNHNWFGLVSKYKRDITDNIKFSVGTDLRRYYGDHFRQVSSLLGRDSYEQGGSPRFPNGVSATTEYNANPWSALSNFADRDDRIAYNNAETIRYAGLFGQVEYSADAFSAYFQGAVSTQDHVRHELYYETEENEDSEKVVNNGYNGKLGLSYDINGSSSVFFNSGVYSRQPFHDNVFVGNSNVVNLNTNNDAYTALGEDPYELIYQNQLHQGIEIDLGVNASDKLKIKAFGSFGKWDVVGDRDVELYDGLDANDLVQSFVATGDDIKVGQAPQTSYGAGLRYQLTDHFAAEANYFGYQGMYASNGGIELPSY
ncbi:TonB-dependent receptor plug domain-containing protein, partial [Saprospiraceae bacterium]|nr:TonB-dependent receptor plug domain-containing protein [Saprospiraceae bacterium]